MPISARRPPSMMHAGAIGHDGSASRNLRENRCGGNDFRIIDHVAKALRKAGVPAKEIDEFCDEVMSGDDHDLLRRCGQWVTLVPADSKS